MAVIKPSIPKGTRDFSSAEIVKRNYIFNTISTVFKKYGYQEIQTPTMENLSTLTGKYGDEGDKLIFKVLNSGDFLANVPSAKLAAQNSQLLTSEISEKALRYDLTVPFARYVVMHRNEISFPFKRYQIQPVWRADRPQKGRYREFYQCDADVVGSESLINEAEFVLIYHEGISEIETIFSYLSRLSIPDSQYSILKLELDITLARGLNYYTGAIFEVKTNEVAMGSIGGGGRYDDLTGMFGLSDLTGVGISFGADRIYDVLEELKLFPENTSQSTKVLISNFDYEAENYALTLLQQLRNAGISAEIYPSSAKLKKQMSYADDKNIPFVILIGSEEMETGLLSLKNMKTGEQQKLSKQQIIAYLS